MAECFKQNKTVTFDETNDFPKCIKCQSSHYANACAGTLPNASFETTEWADRVAAACLERYSALPRAGKPGADEWTPLAGIVALIPDDLTVQQNITFDKIAERDKTLKMQEDRTCKRRKAVDILSERDENGRGLKLQDDLTYKRSATVDNVSSRSSISASRGVPHNLSDVTPTLESISSIETLPVMAKENPVATNENSPNLGVISTPLEAVPLTVDAPTSLEGLDSTVWGVTDQDLNMNPRGHASLETAVISPAVGISLPPTGNHPSPVGVSPLQVDGTLPQKTIFLLQMGISQPQIAITKSQITISQPQMGTFQPQRAISQPQIGVSQSQIAIPKPQIPISEPHMGIFQPQRAISQLQMGISEPQIANSLPEITIAPPQIPVPPPQMGVSPPVPRGVARCVALASGSKCLGGGELCAGGALVHDSHAEVLARRAFLRYLCHHAQRALATGDSDVLEAAVQGRCRIRPGVSFHLFVTEPPCGDAAIFPSEEHARSGKRCREGEEGENRAKRPFRELSKTTTGETAVKNTNQNAEQNLTQEIVGTSTQEIMKSQAHAFQEFSEATALETTQKNINCDVAQNSTQEIMRASVQEVTNTLTQDIAREACSTVSEYGTCNLDEIMLETVGFTSQQIRRAPTEDIAKASIKTIPQEAMQISSSAAIKGIEQSSNQTFAQEITQSSIQTFSKDFTQNFAIAVTQEIAQSLNQTFSKDITEKSTCTATQEVAQACVETSAQDLSTDVHRTGAKCVRGGVQDSRMPGVGYHVTGAIRTKPGRGDPTLSLSCSDKMARWHAVGVQGALLSLLVAPPVRFRSVVIAGDVAWSSAALRRAVAERAGQNRAPLAVARSGLRSPAAREGPRTGRPCAAGLIWSCVPQRPHEVVARGRKQGVTKKAADSTAGRLMICRKELAREFVRVFSAFSHRLSAPRPDPVCLHDQIPGLNDEEPGFDAEDWNMDSKNPVLDSQKRDVYLMDVTESQRVVIEKRKLDLNEREIDTEDKQSPGVDCKQPGLSDSKNEENNINTYVRDNESNYSSETVKICLGVGDFVTSCRLCSLNKTVPKESKRNRDYVADGSQLGINGIGLVADEDLGKMTYAQLKAMAYDYQHHWRRVRETHFPEWPTKPPGLQDFVVMDK